MQATLLTKWQCNFIYYKSRATLMLQYSASNAKELGSACQTICQTGNLSLNVIIIIQIQQETMETNPKGY